MNIELDTICPRCRKHTTLVVDESAHDMWKSGAYIQVAFPELSVDQREMMITGYCGSCWDILFPDEDE